MTNNKKRRFSLFRLFQSTQGTLLSFYLIVLSISVFPIVEADAQDVVLGKDIEGRLSILATRYTGDFSLDGKLDESIYQTVVPITNFIQQIPNEGAEASERTEVWVFFDKDNLYITAKNYESVPESEWVANEMRRDTIQLRSNDSFSVMLDTFLDRRNGVAFLVTPIGGFSDFAISNEGNGGRGINSDWNVVWSSRTGRFEGGWTVEMQIPFRSLRYEPGAEQVWGIQLRRIIRRHNEASYFTELPISAARGNSVIAGLWRISEAGTLTGLEVPPRNFNIEIKPYGLGSVTTNRVVQPEIENETDGEAGVDVKFGITNNLTADFTYNTDFAQVEVDERQVNLTRFSVLFPEKREFFLEGRGNFDFTTGTGLDTPTLFFSRKIGLQQGSVVPINVGGRLTGKVGNFEIGALNISTDASDFNNIESTNFSVLRVKRDVLRRSTVGAIFTDRSKSLVGDGSSQLFGIDGSFDFFDNVSVDTYIAKTDSPNLNEKDSSYMGNFVYDSDRYGASSGYLVVEDNFNPEVGFLRRDNFKQYAGSARFSPRPSSIEWIRRFNFEVDTQSYWSDLSDELETRHHGFTFLTELENSDQITFALNDQFEMLT